MKTPEEIAEFVKEWKGLPKHLHLNEALDIIEQLQQQVAERDAVIASLGEICRVIESEGCFIKPSRVNDMSTCNANSRDRSGEGEAMTVTNDKPERTEAEQIWIDTFLYDSSRQPINNIQLARDIEARTSPRTPKDIGEQIANSMVKNLSYAPNAEISHPTNPEHWEIIGKDTAKYIREYIAAAINLGIKQSKEQSNAK